LSFVWDVQFAVPGEVCVAARTRRFIGTIARVHFGSEFTLTASPILLTLQFMRTALSKNEGERKRFKATFVRVGKKTNYKGYSEDTILLQNIIDIADNQRVADHVWFTFTKTFEDAAIREGDIIAFDARIKRYTKGYVNKALNIKKRTTDFKLSHPTSVEVVERKMN
jgi:hypothetical protein